jgi:hypothetical protein
MSHAPFDISQDLFLRRVAILWGSRHGHVDLLVSAVYTEPEVLAAWFDGGIVAMAAEELE